MVAHALPPMLKHNPTVSQATSIKLPAMLLCSGALKARKHVSPAEARHVQIWSPKFYPQTNCFHRMHAARNAFSMILQNTHGLSEHPCLRPSLAISAVSCILPGCTLTHGFACPIQLVISTYPCSILSRYRCIGVYAYLYQYLYL